MSDKVRARYTLEFKQEAVRLIRGGQSIASVSKSLGVAGQTIDNWLKADAAGRLRGASGQAFQRGANGDRAFEGGTGADADGARHPKKSGGVFCEGVAVRYAFIERHRTIWPIVTQCRVLEVSVSGYGQYRTRRLPDAPAPA